MNGSINNSNMFGGINRVDVRVSQFSMNQRRAFGGGAGLIRFQAVF